MNIYERFKNTMEYGGAREIVRKGFYMLYYKSKNKKTLKSVAVSSPQYGLWKGDPRAEHIVVSMTTFPPRFDKIGIVIKSILYQEFKPDRIVIYLDGKTTYNDLTDEMKSFEKYGVEYRFHNETLLKAHSKYLFAMQDFPESIVVTTDDDVILPSNWLGTLMESYHRYPNAVSARRVHLMRYNELGFLPYNHWYDQWRKEKAPSHLLFATGVGGVLYPPHCIDTKALDQEVIKKISFENDDIWLKCWEVMSHTPVVWAENDEIALAETEPEHEIALSNTNVNESRNDGILNRVLEYYNLTPEDFLRAE